MLFEKVYLLQHFPLKFNLNYSIAGSSLTVILLESFRYFKADTSSSFAFFYYSIFLDSTLLLPQMDRASLELVDYFSYSSLITLTFPLSYPIELCVHFGIHRPITSFRCLLVCFESIQYEEFLQA